MFVLCMCVSLFVLFVRLLLLLLVLCVCCLGCRRLKTEEKEENVTWMMMIVFRLFSAFVRSFFASPLLCVS